MTTYKTIADLPVAGVSNDTDLFETSQYGLSWSVTLGQMSASILSDVAGILASGGATPLSSVAALKALTIRPSVVITRGYGAAGDGGGGPPWVWLEGSTATADDFMVVSPAGTPVGRYIRQFQAGSAVSPKWAGAGLGAADDNARFQVVVAAPGSHAVDCSGCTIRISNIDILAAHTCPGIFSDGSGTITGVVGQSNSFPLEISKGDFFVDRMFFDLPISTNPASPAGEPAYGVALAFASPGSKSERIRVTNCRFRGGVGAFAARNAAGNGDLWFTDNVITDCWGDATSIMVPRNCYFTGNTVERCGVYPAGTDSACHFTTNFSTTNQENLIISHNVIRDCNRGFTQEAIDMFGWLARNVVITDNIFDRVSYGGIEIKTVASAGVPDFQGDVLIANNIFNFTTDAVTGSGGLGVALNGGPDHKMKRYVVSGNMFISDDATPAVATAILVGPQDDVSVVGNTIYNIEAGIIVNPASDFTNACSNVVIQGNNVRTRFAGISHSARTVNGLIVRNNYVKTDGTTPFISNGICNDLVCEGNHFETTSNEICCFFSGVTGGVFAYNTVTTTHAGIQFDGAPCANFKLYGNWVQSTFGIVVGSNSPTLAVFDNNSTNWAVQLTGPGACLSYNNWRDAIAVNPNGVYGGTKGDIIPNSAPTAGGVKEWICTTTGTSATAVWKPVAIGA